MPRNSKPLNPDKSLQAYIIGVAIGDGNLTKTGRTVRLRISCDKKYPNLINRIITSLKKLLPENRVGVVDRESLVDISIYSNHLENLLGWKAKGGPKCIQKVRVPGWIKTNKIWIKNCLKGLLETDGSFYFDRGYPMVIFSTLTLELAKDVLDLFALLGYKPHLYKIKQKPNRYGIGFKYQVRLSKNVKKFIKFLQLDKN